MGKREPIITRVRFQQAVNRLEVLRGIRDVPNKLFARLTRRFGAWHLRDGGLDFRMTDRGIDQCLT